MLGDSAQGEDIGFVRHVLWYGGILGACFAIGLLGWFALGVDPIQGSCMALSAVFLLAALGYPRRLYLAVRNTGWFAIVPSGWPIRAVLMLGASVSFLLGLGITG